MADIARARGERKTKRRKKPKDAPKRSMSAFMFFANEVRPGLQAKNPNAKITEVRARALQRGRLPTHSR